MIGNGSTTGGSSPGRAASRLPSGPTVDADRGDDLLADGVERRVRHLGEQLLEVVEQQARPFREHRDRRVGAHRADRLGAVARHRRDDDLQLLVRVAEHLLAAQHALVAEHDVLALGQLVEVDEARVQPLLVRAARRRAWP